MSKSVEKFNGLNGMVATREELQQISIIAENEEQFHIKKRVDSVLNDDDCDEISLIKPPTQINEWMSISCMVYDRSGVAIE